MILNIGINGFGRIGKCVFLQLINNNDIQVTCINSLDLSVYDIEDYLKYDSTHKNYDKDFKVKIISENVFQINNHTITLVSDRNPKNISWRKYGCNIVVEATGSFLTTEKCLQHDVDNVIITSPAKDNTPTYIYGVNHDKYKGENIISAASCTTNSLAPILNILSKNYGIHQAIFTTIHASTASQNIVDIVNQKARTSRSIFNNIIPHTTGASSSITFVLPELDGKVFGTSVRVPVVNCSLLDLNVELEKNVDLNDIYDLIKTSNYYGELYNINNKKLVSSDFLTTATPCILDSNSTISMGNGKFKFFVWYDNEWSYSTQIIRLIYEINKFKQTKYITNTNILKKHFIENMNFNNKKVVCRFDYNVPINETRIVDDFRIYSTLQTIKYISSQKPKYIVLVSHLGRPNGIEEKKSLKIIIPILEMYLKTNVIFLDKGLTKETLDILSNDIDGIPVYLLENIRFHKEETNYEKMTEKDLNENEVFNIYKQLGDTYICDAFGCMHRKHMSIHGISRLDNFGYGYLVKKEIENISNILNNDKSKLVIIGGNKIKDKMPFIDLMKNISNTKIFVGGKIASEYNNENNAENIYIMSDGYGSVNLESKSEYISDIRNTDLNIYDIGDESLNLLYNLVNNNDIIFWNGSLGVIENQEYVKGSMKLIDYLKKQNDKIIIIGGGDTSTLINKNGNIYVSTGGGALLEYLENISKNKSYLIGLDIFTEN